MMNDHMSNPWVTLSSDHRHEDKYLRVDVDQVRHHSGHEHPHTALRFKVYGIAVLPVYNDGSVCLVGQYRYVLERFTWEAIRGSDPLSHTPVDTARRELVEEVGAEAAFWLELPSLHASPGITSELAPCFIAWGLRQVGNQPEPVESLNLRRLPFAQALDAALSGEVVDAASVTLLLGAAERARRRMLPEDLVALLKAGGL